MNTLMEGEEKLGGRREVGSQVGRAAAAQGGGANGVGVASGRPLGSEGRCWQRVRASSLDAGTDRGRELARAHRLDAVSPRRGSWRGTSAPRSAARQRLPRPRPGLREVPRHRRCRVAMHGTSAFSADKNVRFENKKNSVSNLKIV